MKEIEEKAIRNACFKMACDLIWGNNILAIQETESDLKESFEMTDEFFRIAMYHYQTLEYFGKSSEILVRAINYINHVHAVPPVKGQYQWFSEALIVLLELVCPNTIIDKNSPAAQFLKDIEKGITQSLNNEQE